MKFVECCSAHDACAGLLQDGVQGHSVAFTELADFNEARRIFVRDVKDSALHEIWEEGAKLFAGIFLTIIPVIAMLSYSPLSRLWPTIVSLRLNGPETHRDNGSGYQ